MALLMPRSQAVPSPHPLVPSPPCVIHEAGILWSDIDRLVMKQMTKPTTDPYSVTCMMMEILAGATNSGIADAVSIGQRASGIMLTCNTSHGTERKPDLP